MTKALKMGLLGLALGVAGAVMAEPKPSDVNQCKTCMNACERRYAQCSGSGSTTCDAALEACVRNCGC